jgi:threonine dehydrogenase-like Zn-dependent dehydrogenase
MEAPGRLLVREFDVPDPEPGAVVMKVHLSGICGTDKHTFRGESQQYAGTPHARSIEYPLICGHENVGVVAAVGGEVRNSQGRPLRIGDRIVPAANVACGRCYFCQSGQPYYFCEQLEDYGNSLNCSRSPYLFGGWSEYMYLLPGTPIFPVPDELPDKVAVITEVMAVTHGVETAASLLSHQGGSAVGATVAVLGMGPLGLCHLIKARLLGAGRLLATDMLPNRLGIARDLGADLTIDASTNDEGARAEAVLGATEGRGADIVIDCTGFPESFSEALHLVRTGGVVIEAGAFIDLGPVTINPNSDICTRNVAVLGVGGETVQAYEPSMRLLAANLSRYPLERIVSHSFPLADAQEAVVMSQSNEAMQVVLDPTSWEDVDACQAN